MQRGGTAFVFRIDVRTVRDEFLGDGYLSFGSGPVERGIVEPIRRIDIGAARNELFHFIDVARFDRFMQRAGQRRGRRQAKHA